MNSTNEPQIFNRGGVAHRIVLGAGATRRTSVALLCAVLTTLALALSLFLPASASAATITVTEAGSPKLRYDAYRLIDGDIAMRDGNPAVVDGALAPAYREALTASLKEAGRDPGISASDSASVQVAKVVEALNDAAAAKPADPASIQSVARTLARSLAASQAVPTTSASPSSTGILELEGLPTGYYLIATNEDSLASLSPADSQIAATAILIALPETGASSTVKALVPSVSKQVGELDASGKPAWGKIADAGMLAWTPYRVTGTLPSNWDEFTAYFYEFTDARDDALEIDRASVTVELLDAQGEVAQDLTRAFSIKDEDGTLTVICDDLKAAAPTATAAHAVRMSYRARLIPGKASAGTKDPADNYVYLSYTRAPGSEGHGRTTEDHARLLTWAIDLTKVASADPRTSLAGASFTLRHSQGGYVQADGSTSSDAYEFTTDASGRIAVVGLDAGSYTLTETRAPQGYALLDEPIAIEITHELNDQTARLGAGIDHASVTVTNVDAAAGSIAITVANDEPGTPPGTTGKRTPGWIPQTGDAAFAAVAVLAISGVLAIAISRAIRRDGSATDR